MCAKHSEEQNLDPVLSKSDNAKFLFLPSRVCSYCYKVEFWQKSEPLVCKLPQVLNVRALIIWELEQGFRAERR